MKEYKTPKAIVRIHGSINQEKLKEETIRFMKEKERRGKKHEKTIK